MLALTKCSRPRSTNGRASDSAIRSATRIASRSVLDVLDQDGELVAAEARDGVARAQRLLEARRDRGEQLVAGGVPEAVVDELELVEVEEEDGDRAVGAPRLAEGVLEAVEEEGAVGQAR